MQGEPNASGEAVEHPVAEMDGRLGHNQLLLVREAIQYYRAEASLSQLRRRLLRRVH